VQQGNQIGRWTQIEIVVYMIEEHNNIPDILRHSSDIKLVNLIYKN